MKKVIFNADDFGYSRGVNLGIIEAFKHGTVRSTTLMTNMYALTMLLNSQSKTLI